MAASQVLESALAGGAVRSDAAGVLVGLALHDDDRRFVEYWCLRIGRQAPVGSPLLGLAALCVGHLARRFGEVSDDAAALVVDLALRPDVDGRAKDGLEDLRRFADRDVPDL